MQPMLQDGIGKVAAGLTSVEEVMRVTREIE
jgi:type II secretory ATPase GspE/PulE/Tfp pilus assembly ATPase PilB-like protein